MRRHVRFFLLCTAAILMAGCSDTNEPVGTAGPEATLSKRQLTTGCQSIGDRVWLDLDCDGVQDKNDAGFTEPGVADVTVNLYNCDGDLLATTTTDATGFYLFSDLDEYGQYRVCFVLPAGYTFTAKDQGGSEGSDSDAGADGCSDCIDPVDCKPFRNIDAGLCRDESEPCAEIGDRVWVDENCNGLQDKNDQDVEEQGLAGVIVNLYTCAGALVDTDVTDASGNYLFTDVDDALSYRVCFVLPDGYDWSPKDQGANDGIDSDVNADGCTDCFELDECEVDRTRDAGVCREEEGESCSPGFWKNHYTHWVPTGYSPSDIFDDVFGCEIFGDDTTLGEAIHIEWTHNVLAFHGVAALLNATHPDVDGFAYTEDEVKDLVCDRNKTALSASVTDICPLSGGNTRRESRSE
jgi:hypothetical protein